MMSTIFKANLLGFAVLMLVAGCAKQPPIVVAHGEDYGLFPKAELRDGPYDPKSLTGKASKLARVAVADEIKMIDFAIGESILNIFEVEPTTGERQAYLQFPIKGHWDLVRDRDRSGSENQYLVKDRKANPAWQDREYIEVDPYDVKRIDLERERAERDNHLIAVSALQNAAFKLLEEQIPGVDQRMALEIARQHSLKKGDKVYIRLTFDEMILQKRELTGSLTEIAALPIRYLDLVQRENAASEKTHELRVDDQKSEWTNRRYVQVRPDAVKVSANHVKLVDKKAISECQPFDRVAVAEIVSDLRHHDVVLGSDDQVCFDISQTVLTVRIAGPSRNEDVLTYDILAHMDYLDFDDQAANQDTISVGTAGSRTWENRRFISFAASKPQPIKNLAGSNTLPKKAFNGEFLYISTIDQSHSEMGGHLVPGMRNTSDSRLRFEFSENKLSVYRVRETLNSSNPAPVLRYTADHFTVERVRNSFGDPTNTIAEVRERPWQKREHTRINFSRNEIPGYFNEFFGTEKLLFRQYLITESRMVGDVHLEDDGMIWFLTEEVLTPNLLANHAGHGETQLQPKSVLMRHSFMPVGKRNYEPKVYDEYDFARFGFFRTAQLTLDENETATDQTKNHFINRFDLSDNKQITLTVNKDFPEEYWELTQRAIDEWNQAFEAATGRKDVLTLVPNSGEEYTDPRVNMIAFIPERNISGILGYGPMIVDPDTGETLSAQTYMYESVFRAMMRRVEDIYDFVAEQLPPSEKSDIASLYPSIADTASMSESAFDIPNLPLQAIISKERVTAIAFETKGLRPTNLQRTLERTANVGSVVTDSILEGELGQAMFEAAAVLATKYEQRQTSTLVANRLDCFINEDDHFSSAVKYIRLNRDRPKHEVLQEIRLQAVYTTLLHELGHNFGLRHNFHGSFDELNYASDYFELQAELQRNPNIETKERFAEMYTSSSVMDYQDVFHDQATGLGFYDIAAIKYGYGDIMEVLDVEESTALGYPVSQNITKAEFTSEVKALMAEHPNASRQSVETAVASMMNIRPYLFCTDHDVDDDPTCNRHDSGRTMDEIVKNTINDYESNYLLYGFRNDRRNFTGNSTSVLGRYLLPIRQVLDEFAYRSITNTFAPQGAGSQQDFINALSRGFDFFVNILSTVEPGTYHFDETEGHWVRGSKAGARTINVPLGIGKYMETLFERVGSEERVLRRGIEFDKIATLLVMTMRGFPAQKYQRASLSLNYFDLLNEPVFESFSELMRDNLKTELTALKGDNDQLTIIPSALANELSSVADIERIKIPASTSLGIKSYAMIFASDNFNSTSNQTFGDYIDFRVAGIDDTSLPDGREAARFSSANGLKTYVVPQTRDRKSISYLIAAEAPKLSERLDELDALIVDAEEFLPAFAEIAFNDVETSFTFIHRMLTDQSVPTDIIAQFRADKPFGLTRMLALIEQWKSTLQAQLASASASGNENAVRQIQSMLNVIGEHEDGFEETVSEFRTLNNQYQSYKQEAQVVERKLTTIESQLIQLRRLYEALN